LWKDVPLFQADLAGAVFLLAIGIVMFFRFTSLNREQARASAELSAAREIQQQLDPHLCRLSRVACLRPLISPLLKWAETSTRFYSGMTALL
jgi:hypothetical protein